LRLALRSYRDQEFVDTPGIATRALYGYTAPEPVPAGEPAAVGKPRPAPYVVEVLMGSKIFRQEFERDGSSAPLVAVPDVMPGTHDLGTLSPAVVGG
jgi:hypothetical protein